MTSLECEWSYRRAEEKEEDEKEDNRCRASVRSQ